MILSLTFASWLNWNDGLFYFYYNGDDIGADCGMYYLTIKIGGITYYSELFKIEEINDSLIPEIKFNNLHLALPFYSDVTHQNRYLCEECCEDIPINILGKLIPFMFEVTGDAWVSIAIYLVDLSGNENEITSELTLTVTTFSGQTQVYCSGSNFNLTCGIYYLKAIVTLAFGGGDITVYSEVFKVTDIYNTPVFAGSDYIVTEDDIPIETEDGQLIIVE